MCALCIKLILRYATKLGCVYRQFYVSTNIQIGELFRHYRV